MMQFIEADDRSLAISGLTRQMEEDRCTLRWNWPGGLEAVYIGRLPADQADSEATRTDHLKLYTRAEYKANNGYHSRIEGVGLYVFTIYAFKEASAGTQLIVQRGRENRIEVSAGRARVRCEISSKGGLFKKFKTLQIIVTTEVPLAQDVLCYVKKQGGYPANKEDGLQYPFVAPFAAGRTALPPIEVGKDEFIRLFFTDGRTYGQMYELISG
jgi:hypothetical protein